MDDTTPIVCEFFPELMRPVTQSADVAKWFVHAFQIIPHFGQILSSCYTEEPTLSSASIRKRITMNVRINASRFMALLDFCRNFFMIRRQGAIDMTPTG